MKYNTLYNIVYNLKPYKYLTLAKRVRENLLLLIFDNYEYIYFDVTRGNSNIFATKNNLEQKLFQSSFDISLKKLFTKSKIEKISMINNDKIVQIIVLKNSAYKQHKYILQIELTSRFTNIIILDENNIIINALRFTKNSTREVLQNHTLPSPTNVPKFNYQYKNNPDIIQELESRFVKLEDNQLQSIKISKNITLQNQLKKLNKILLTLENEDKLLEKSDKLYIQANEMLANIHNQPITNNYEKTSSIINDLFKKAKKLKQKAKNINIEFNNLQDKIKFLQNKIILLQNTNDLDKLYTLFPPKSKQNKKENKNQNIESIYFKGFKLSYGKNSIGNEYLLKTAKANDIWMHLQGMPSTHVIIHTNKTNIPQDVLELGANLCVEYSVNDAGDYIVDYTKRKFVKIIENSFTNYTNQKSIHMLKVDFKNPFLNHKKFD